MPWAGMPVHGTSGGDGGTTTRRQHPGSVRRDTYSTPFLKIKSANELLQLSKQFPYIYLFFLIMRSTLGI